jgi:hypothetical protein
MRRLTDLAKPRRSARVRSLSSTTIGTTRLVSQVGDCTVDLFCKLQQAAKHHRPVQIQISWNDQSQSKGLFGRRQRKPGTNRRKLDKPIISSLVNKDCIALHVRSLRNALMFNYLLYFQYRINMYYHTLRITSFRIEIFSHNSAESF